MPTTPVDRVDGEAEAGVQLEAVVGQSITSALRLPGVNHLRIATTDLRLPPQP